MDIIKGFLDCLDPSKQKQYGGSAGNEVTPEGNKANPEGDIKGTEGGPTDDIKVGEVGALDTGRKVARIFDFEQFKRRHRGNKEIKEAKNFWPTFPEKR